MLYDNQEAALREAIEEAKRFIKRANAAFDEKKNHRWASKECASAKRSSLDLTRALAKFRQA